MASMKGAPRVRADCVLVVDDYEDNRQMYAELLSYAGFAVVEASNGAEGLATAQTVLPDLIVMDLSLPVMDGWEATRRLKGDERTRHIPVLALSGHAQEGLLGLSEGAHEAGCDGFLSKPCSPEALLEIVRDVLARTQARRAQGASALPRRPPRRLTPLCP